MTDTARLEKAVFDAIFDPGAEVGMKHDRSLTSWQTDAVMNVLSRISLLDELDASKARIGEVKPLVWEAQRIDKTFWIGVAPLSGEYRVKHIEDDWELVRGIINIGAYPTCDEAKAAAQADYTARILSALAPSPHGDAK
jgi:hypothetical protein